MIRRFFMIPVVALAASGALAQEGPAPQTCDETFEPACEEAGTISICAEGTVQSFSCTDFGPGGADASCGTLGCDGASCSQLGVACVAPEGGSCIGLSVYTNEETADDQLFAGVLCEGNASCQLTVGGTQQAPEIGDSCVPHVGPACVAGGEATACTDNIWTVCLGDGEGTLALTSNIAVDCALFGTTCGDTPCECDEQCGEGGSCVEGVCNTGKGCIFPSEIQCGGGGNGGEGEGEGEPVGGSQCTDDAECGRDRQCVSGECVAAEEETDSTEEEDTTGGSNVNVSCASASANVPFAALLLGLAPLARRRRK